MRSIRCVHIFSSLRHLAAVLSAASCLAGCIVAHDPAPALTPGVDGTGPAEIVAPDAAVGSADMAAAAPDAAVVPPPPGSDRFVRDDQGGVLILRGINVESAAKSDPERLARITAEDAQRIGRRWGMNLARYLILWDALEPTPGEIDHAYLDKVAVRVDLLWAEGIHVLIDMHQDVYARRFCCDGAPDWAIRDDGEPFELQGLWFLNYLQPAVIRAFDNFWDHDGPHADLQVHYAAAWQAVATRFRDHPGVIGYDLINEPHPGSRFDLGEAVGRQSPEDGGMSRQFDEEDLGPFYQRLVDAVRAVDPDGWIFFEPRYGAPGNGSPSWLPRLSDPRAGGPRLVYAPHLYSVVAEASGEYGVSDGTVAAWEAERAADAARLATPVVAGEWGFAWSTLHSEQYVADILAMMDRQMFGWAYWSWDPSGPDGWSPWSRDTGEDNPLAAWLVRATPHRVAGDPRSFGFERATGVFTLVARLDASIPGATRLFLPSSVYGAGYEVTVDGAGSGAWVTTWDVERSVLSLTWSGEAGEHTVVVRPK